MLLQQQMHIDHNDPQKKITLRNTIDCSAAVELAAEGSKSAGGNKDFYCLGHIPPEMWSFNPWLLAAKQAKREGDMGKYHKNIMKFFNLFPSFKVLHRPRNFWIGGGC